MDGYVKFWWQATPNFFDSIMFRAVRGAILDSLNKINRAVLFKLPLSKNPHKAHVKLQKLILGAESKLHAIFSADFISLHQGLLGKKLWTKLIGPFFIRGPSLRRYLWQKTARSTLFIIFSLIALDARIWNQLRKGHVASIQLRGLIFEV